MTLANPTIILWARCWALLLILRLLLLRRRPSRSPFQNFRLSPVSLLLGLFSAFAHSHCMPFPCILLLLFGLLGLLLLAAFPPILFLIFGHLLPTHCLLLRICSLFRSLSSCVCLSVFCCLDFCFRKVASLGFCSKVFLRFLTSTIVQKHNKARRGYPSLRRDSRSKLPRSHQSLDGRGARCHSTLIEKGDVGKRCSREGEWCSRWPRCHSFADVRHSTLIEET